MKTLMIDCDTCSGVDCADCVMTFLASSEMGEPVRFTTEETTALKVMADAGLVPELRLVVA